MSRGWRIERSPLAHLEAWKGGKQVGEAVWAEGRRWYCQIDSGRLMATVRTKRQAIRWLLAHCPVGAAVNEMTHQWARLPNSPTIKAAA